ncbi:cytochrome c-type biogenesis protein CcmH [Aliiglaciecola sp. M165]|uniref:cytochrome c-type biogenesis protein n=1 Tax=Aliiglaciecola sp. M165 TaxID=2593649 RepID=UPI00117EFE1D|nr:cytochrome c-type biogenesis protein [Aliiglaciecola sp. M165]TRY31334.1 cytochrome c-type biogenesis protein CcmH [Aliiglaciecola sp. M165]
MKQLTILFGILTFLAFPVLAAEEAFVFDDPAKQKIFLELTQELRCPQCQNQNIADSDAMIAHDLRRKVYELLQQGKSRQEVVDFMKARYGDFVSYKPPVTPLTVWLWLLPPLFVLIALGVVFSRRKKQTEDFDEAVLAKADSLLEKDK